MGFENLSRMDTESIDWRTTGAGIVLLAVILVGVTALWQPVNESGGDQIAVTMTVDAGAAGTDTETLTVANNTTAFGALNASHAVEYQTSSQGIFITGIDGTTQNGTHSWLFFVNGDPPSVGANAYTLSDGDNVTFRFVSNEQAMEFFE